ncbi:hypothetical protein OAO18_06215 [Francisellaceae bacterium]|nr:hypothetical protein [Francisellaceae bacterium]
MALDDNNGKKPKKSHDHSSLKLAETGSETSENTFSNKDRIDEKTRSSSDNSHKGENTKEKVESGQGNVILDEPELNSEQSLDHSNEEQDNPNGQKPKKEQNRSHKKSLFIILLIITILVAAYIVWLKYYKAVDSEKIEPVGVENSNNVEILETAKPEGEGLLNKPTGEASPKDINLSVEDTPSTPMPQPPFINSIEFSDKFEFPKLNIDLSKKVFYQIYESSGEITLVFPETKANSNLIEMNNPFIKLVNINYFKNQTTVNIVLQDDIKLGNIGYTGAGSLLELSFQNILTKRNMDVSQIKSVQQTPENKTQTQQRAYYKALDVANVGDYPKAIKLMKPLTEGDEPYLPAIENLAILYLKSLRINDAEKLLEQAVKAYPTNIKLKEYYARLLIIKKQFPQALQFLMKASPSLNEYPNYYGLIAFLNLEEQKPKVAQLYYMQLVEAMPDNVKWMLGLAMSLKMQGANNAAEAVYKRILENGNIPPNIKLYVSQQMANFF